MGVDGRLFLSYSVGHKGWLRVVTPPILLLAEWQLTTNRLWREQMSYVEIRDHALWLKHIHGNEELKTTLQKLGAGELIELEIDGFRGMWKKMDNGKDGRRTQGIKALGKGREHWHNLQSRRGDLVSINHA